MVDYLRRCDVTRMTPAERAIRDAIQAVEAVGADPRLTDAVRHLLDAQRALADFVDGAPLDLRAGSPRLNDPRTSAQ